MHMIKRLAVILRYTSENDISSQMYCVKLRLNGGIKRKYGKN